MSQINRLSKEEKVNLLRKVTGDPSATLEMCPEHLLEHWFEMNEDPKWKDPKWAEAKRYHEQYILQKYKEHKYKPTIPSNRLRFYPGGYSGAGFLDWDEVLEDVIAEDMAFLEKLGVNHKEVGLKLKNILDKAWKVHCSALPPELEKTIVGLKNRKIGEYDGVKFKRIGPAFSEGVKVGEYKYKVWFRVWRGYQECPFCGCGYSYSHLDFILRNTVTKEEIKGPGLIWHLIAEHKFFEGRGSSYRVEPEQLVKVLFGQKRTGTS